MAFCETQVAAWRDQRHAVLHPLEKQIRSCIAQLRIDDHVVVAGITSALTALDLARQRCWVAV